MRAITSRRSIQPVGTGRTACDDANPLHPESEVTMSVSVQQGLVEHAGIDRAFREVLDAFKEGRTHDAPQLCVRLFDRLRTHLMAEEAALDAYHAIDPDEADALRAEHCGFLATMDDLLNVMREGELVADDVLAFKARFSLHEAREETGLYRRVPTIAPPPPAE